MRELHRRGSGDVPGTEIYIALGVLSSADNFETGRAVASRSALMRNRVRQGAQIAGIGHGVALRFILALRNGHKALPPPPHVLAEASTHGDLVFLNTTERFYLCGWKYHLWFAHAAAAFPTASWFAVADNDAFVQLAHLSDDLRSVRGLIGMGGATQHILCALCLERPGFVTGVD